MELAAQDARPVPTKVSRKQDQSNGPGASANPAQVVPMTRAAREKQWSLVTTQVSDCQCPNQAAFPLTNESLQ